MVVASVGLGLPLLPMVSSAGDDDGVDRHSFAPFVTASHRSSQLRTVRHSFAPFDNLAAVPKSAITRKLGTDRPTRQALDV